eukprot:CAMPEP_0206608526 /NCGR_PEP_ID=MMETSP0325_2-20121206/53091_1 /ASSEMBLY_ACC=CAM_ASM_000347 /TAXON_ID=2866 /ORGANISM="Crypthecodinium cohnii, Strain Seligo" /LENGTH=167 /DNA_ID=CAMNT_0054126333 /DNA_START=38 /DNA_END=541 /DNA_ORIENTATION=-
MFFPSLFACCAQAPKVETSITEDLICQCSAGDEAPKGIPATTEVAEDVVHAKQFGASASEIERMEKTGTEGTPSTTVESEEEENQAPAASGSIAKEEVEATSSTSTRQTPPSRNKPRMSQKEIVTALARQLDSRETPVGRPGSLYSSEPLAPPKRKLSLRFPSLITH